VKVSKALLVLAGAAAGCSCQEITGHPVPACPEAGLVDIDVAVAEGDQVVPKVAAAEDGHSWFSWYSHESGNYNVRIQHFDERGEELLDPGGLLVSDNPSDAWVADHALVTGPDGSAVLAFSDVRTGTFDVFAYRISPEGGFEWGPDGVALSASPDDELTPKAIGCTDGDLAFAWDRIDPATDVTSVVLQRLSPDGTILWGDGIAIEAGGGRSAVRPWIVPSDEGSLIAVWIETPDAMSYDRIILARRIAAGGEPVWSADSIVVEGDSIPFFYDPVPVADGSGGAYVAWTSIYNGVQARSFVQHIEADGSAAMPEGGVPFSTSTTTQQYNPALALAPSGDAVLAVWRESDMDQTESGIHGQIFSPVGERSWPDAGLEIVEVSPLLTYIWGLGPTPEGAVILIGDQPYGSVDSYRVAAGLLDIDSPSFSPVVLCDVDGAKSHPHVDTAPGCGAWIVWDDMRADGGDVRAAFFSLE